MLGAQQGDETRKVMHIIGHPLPLPGTHLYMHDINCSYDTYEHVCSFFLLSFIQSLLHHTFASFPIDFLLLSEIMFASMGKSALSRSKSALLLRQGG